MGKTRELILVHQAMKGIAILPSAGINLLLTPQFYTVVREALPVKYVYEAKRIAPSLFEGLLEDEVSYEYFVQKEEDTWLFIAYSHAKIAYFLSEKGIKVDDVSKMYFAEQSLASFVSPVALGEREVLMNLHGKMTILPKNVLEENIKTIAIDNSFRPKKGVSLVLEEESLLSSSDSYTVAAIFVLFASIYFVEASRYGGSSVAQDKEIQELLENEPSMESSYTRDSILDKYRTIDKHERMKREVIKSLASMIFKGSVLSHLSMNDKKFQANFECKDSATIKRLKALAKKENFRLSSVAKNTVKIEGTL